MTHYRSQFTTIRDTMRNFMLPCVLLLALVTAPAFFLFFGSSHATYAHTSSFETCATATPAQKEHLCTGADPILGGCTFDAKVVEQQPVMLDGSIVGLIQVRSSPFCHTYWGRGLSYRPRATISVYIADLGTNPDATYLSTSNEVYSNMVYASAPHRNHPDCLLTDPYRARNPGGNIGSHRGKTRDAYAEDDTPTNRGPGR